VPRRSEALASAPTWAERLLSVGGGDAPEAASQRLRDFRRFLLLYGAARSWLWVTFPGGATPLLVGAALLASAGAALAFRPAGARGEPAAARLGLAAVLAQASWHFPFGANHLYLELVCLACLSLVGGAARARDEALALAALRLVTALVLFHTGLQKVFYGLYFRGEFLAFMVGSDERFGRAFAWLLPADELARLSGLDRRQTGAGPFRTDSPLLVLASNAVWMAELALPAFLLWPRTRVLGALGGLALMLGIQVAALELGFALLFVNLLLLFLPGRWNARALPAAVALLGWGLLAALGVVPGRPSDWNLL
jgi:hypothetical protein